MGFDCFAFFSGGKSNNQRIIAGTGNLAHISFWNQIVVDEHIFLVAVKIIQNIVQ